MRIIPKDGITISRHTHEGSILLRYVDVEDVSEDNKKFFTDYYKTDKDPYLHMFDTISMGYIMDRRARVHVFIDDKPMAIYSFNEYIDNPYGYGKGDFLMIKYPVTQYRHTKIVRFASTDLFHMMFKSGLMKRMYALAPITTEDTDSPLKKIDIKKAPCHSVVYHTDHKNVQKYIFISKVIEGLEVPNIKIGIFEINGDIYNSMNILDYYNAAGGYSSVAAKKTAQVELLKELDSAAAKVKELING